MNQFFRAFRLVFRYKWTLAASTFTALMVALLWGVNIGGALPVITVITQNKSLQQYLDDDIRSSQGKISKLEDDVKTAKADLAVAPADQQATLQRNLRSKENSLSVEQKHLSRDQHIKPYLDAYLPHDPYKALFLIMMVISAGYILKNIFLVFDSILVDRLANLATLDLRKRFYRRTLRMDLSSFGKARVSELMARFTNDIDSINGGIQTVLGARSASR